MLIPIFQVDSFATHRFTGNPAAVMLLDRYPVDSILQAIAAENNLAETAFLVPEAGDYRLRWFTPTREVPLCGHATLASAAVVMERLQPDRQSVLFQTLSGPLPVRRTESGYAMNFPVRHSQVTAPPPGLAAALGVVPVEVHVNEFNYMVVLKNPPQLRGLAPDMASLTRLNRSGVIATAPGEGDHDFISRYFAPAKGIPEDPVTGAAHCMLVPYWARRLGKTEFRAFQASRRGGEIVCRLFGDRVELKDLVSSTLKEPRRFECAGRLSSLSVGWTWYLPSRSDQRYGGRC